MQQAHDDVYHANKVQQLCICPGSLEGRGCTFPGVGFRAKIEDISPDVHFLLGCSAANSPNCIGAIMPERKQTV